MGFWDGLLSIGSAIFEKVGSFISAGIQAISEILPPTLNTALKVIGIIAGAVVKICDTLGVLPFTPEPLELGAKVSQPDTRAIEEGETTAHYLEYLHNDVPLDMEKLSKMTDEERLECETIGTGMIKSAIEEKTGIEMSAEFLSSIEKIKLEHEQIVEFIEGFKEKGMNSMSGFTDYLSGKLDESQLDTVDSIITQSLQVLNPEKSQEDIRSEIAEMKTQYRINE